MRISDWSSDVCSSDLGEAFIRQFVNEEMLRIKEEIAKTNEGGNDALAGEMADQLAKRVSDLDIVSQIRMPVIADLMRGLLLKVEGVRLTSAIDNLSFDNEKKNSKLNRTDVAIVSRLESIQGLSTEQTESFKQRSEEHTTELQS